MSDPNKLRLDECSKYFDAKFVGPSDKEVKSDSFDIVFDCWFGSIKTTGNFCSKTWWIYNSHWSNSASRRV